jgi:hypothetical protein
MSLHRRRRLAVLKAVALVRLRENAYIVKAIH